MIVLTNITATSFDSLVEHKTDHNYTRYKQVVTEVVCLTLGLYTPQQTETPQHHKQHGEDFIIATGLWRNLQKDFVENYLRSPSSVSTSNAAPSAQLTSTFSIFFISYKHIITMR